MKKLALVALAAATAFATPAMAADTSVEVFGTISGICTISATPQISLGELSTNVSGSTDVELLCNDPQGATTKVWSKFGGKLQSGESTTTFDYVLADAQGSRSSKIVPTTTPTTVPFMPSTAPALVGGKTVKLMLFVTGQTGPSYSGTYADVVTLSISAN